jgi:hypothetical protein
MVHDPIHPEPAITGLSNDDLQIHMTSLEETLNTLMARQQATKAEMRRRTTDQTLQEQQPTASRPDDRDNRATGENTVHFDRRAALTTPELTPTRPRAATLQEPPTVNQRLMRMSSTPYPVAGAVPPLQLDSEGSLQLGTGMHHQIQQRPTNGQTTLPATNSTRLGDMSLLATQSSKLMINNTPVFDGTRENFPRWLDAMDAINESCRTHDEFKTILTWKTAGGVAEIIRTFGSAPWTTIRERLRDDYDPRGSAADAFLRWNTLQQGVKHIVAHCEEVVGICRVLEINIDVHDPNANFRFIQSLASDKARRPLYDQNDQKKTLRQLMDFAKRRWKQHCSSLGIDPHAPPKAENASTMVGRPTGGSDKDVRAQRLQWTEINQRKHKCWCEICDSSRHSTEDCPHTNATKCAFCDETFTAGQALDHSKLCRSGACFACGRRGHTKQQCKMVAAELRQKKRNRSPSRVRDQPEKRRNTTTERPSRTQARRSNTNTVKGKKQDKPETGSQKFDRTDDGLRKKRKDKMTALTEEGAASGAETTPEHSVGSPDSQTSASPSPSE